MDVGTALSVAQTLFAALECTQLKEVLSMFGYKSQLDDLKVTVESITAVLRDAEAKHELSQQDQLLIEKLKDAVFEADDLFDEFVTLAHQKQLQEADGSVSKKLTNFFSRSKNPLSLAYRMSRGVKDIKKKLDAIAYNKQFNLKIDLEPIRKRSRETCSYVDKVDIIGREHDLEKIVGTLLAPNDHGDVSVISIVGIGGLGKTALAQLVYNDPRVTNAFQLKIWTCVSDEDQDQLDVMKILGKISGSNKESSTLDQVQSKLRGQLAGKKYLLILDDVWTEKRDQWCELVKYFSEEKRGSWIVVTTRSKKTATITGGLMHELLGLSKENTWHLFERTAFSSDKPKPIDDELVEIGQKIVDGCSGVPLAIRVVGSLLYGQDKSEWLSVQKIGLANKTNFNDGIMPILKLSFYQLEAPLKNCFRYCALFPKDYVIEKEKMISLWMAQGYIVPLDKKQSIEVAGEEYFSILLKRCFFQNVNENIFGEIMSCKIHDLMHDIAQNVSGKEMCALDNIKGNIDDNVRHVSISNVREYEEFYSLGKTNIRSLLFFDCNYNFQFLVGGLVKRFKFLRVLDLSDKRIKHLPKSIGDLLHLRYIDLSKNKEMEVVPNSISKLCNLQALILNDCSSLKELPRDLHRLVKLRVLEMEKCHELTCMPRGMGKLTCLHTLSGYYHVGGREKCTSWRQWLGELENLKTLINLRGELSIGMKWPRHAKKDVKEDRREGLYLRDMEYVNTIGLVFGDLKDDSDDEEDMEEEEGIRRVTEVEDEERIRWRVMEDLQPHSNLKRLFVAGYNSVKMPSWFTATLLPHLVQLALAECKELEYLPYLGNLCHLKFLNLENLLNLEYIEEEEDSRIMASTSTAPQKESVFPSLEELELFNLPKFEGWRRVGVQGMEESTINNSSNIKPQLQLCLPQLKDLEVFKCPELTCNLVCPVLETLKLKKFNERLEIIITRPRSTKTEERLREAVVDKNLVPKLREVEVDKVAWLNSMPTESFHTLKSLIIEDDGEMEDLPNSVQHLSALQSLTIERCNNLKAMPDWMPKLTSLQRLRIAYCSERLKERCKEHPPGEDWPYIQHIPHVANY